MNQTVLILHVVFATILVGPQVLLFFAVTPASWVIEDHALRTRVVRVIARRFAVMSVIALLVLLVTGLYQLTSITPEPIARNMLDYRFGPIMIWKTVLVVVLVGLILVHGFVFARRVALVTEAVTAGELEGWALDRARRNSLIFSALIMLVSFIVLALGVMLADHEYSYALR